MAQTSLMHPAMSTQPIAKENRKMNTIKASLSLLAAVSLMGLTLIAQHNYQLKFAPDGGAVISATAAPGAETIALR